MLNRRLSWESRFWSGDILAVLQLRHLLQPQKTFILIFTMTWSNDCSPWYTTILWTLCEKKERTICAYLNALLPTINPSSTQPQQFGWDLIFVFCEYINIYLFLETSPQSPDLMHMTSSFCTLIPWEIGLLSRSSYRVDLVSSECR